MSGVINALSRGADLETTQQAQPIGAAPQCSDEEREDIDVDVGLFSQVA